MAAFDFPASPTDGQIYTANGTTFVWSAADTAWKGQGSQVPLSNKQRVIVYSTPGTIPYARPANLKALHVELYGSGGGGGGCAATAATTMAMAGSGAAGGYSKKLYQADELAATENLVIGAGGAGGTGNPVANGSAGSPTTFKGQTAGGGGAGSSSGASSASGATSRGYSGFGSGGDVNGNGNSGQLGIRFVDGSTTQGQAGYGGGPFGSGFIQAVFVTTTTNQGGTKAALGTGGHGSGNGFNQAVACDGAVGGDAFAVFTEYYADADESVILPDLVMKTTVIDGNDGGANITTDYVKPAGLKYLQVEIWGGGSAGQAAAATGASQYVVSHGGGGGGYSKKLYRADELASTEPVVIGGGGVPGTTHVSAGDSTFKGMIANGAPGSAQVTAVAVAYGVLGFSVRALGGAASGGDINVNGGDGTSGLLFTNDLGTGGMPLGGYGGAAGGPGGQQRTTRPPNSTTKQGGATGYKPGGGGTGVGSPQNNVLDLGGTGAGGRVVFTEYFTELPQEKLAFDRLDVGSNTSLTSILTVRGADWHLADIISKWNGSAESSPDLNLYTDRPTWAADDYGGALRFFKGDPKIAGSKQLAWIAPNIYDVTPGAEYSNLWLGTLSNGVARTGMVIYDGIVQLTGGRLRFPATQVTSSNPNTLDHYEEGNWTPGMAFGSGSGNTGITYAVQTGRYQKIGNKVTLWWDVTLTSKGALTGAVYITGCPFTAGNVASMSYVGSIGYFRDLVADSTQGIGCYVGSGSTLISVSGINATAVQQTALQNTAITNTTRFLGSVSYEAA